MGSSPLTRGKLVRASRRAAASGLIPAHAGKTTRFRRFARSIRAHPRSRGENDDVLVRRFGGEGSSPLTRGKLFVASRRVGERGLIPAHAGKTRKRTRPPPKAAGSSPLTRGKQVAAVGGHGHERLIPAHAGKTAHHDRRRMYRRAHPRSRGENLNRGVGDIALSGSSPLTRGKRLSVEGA